METEGQMDDDMRHVIALHDRVTNIAQALINEGIDPDLVVGAMMTIGIDGTLKTRGRVRTMSVLMDTYLLIAKAVVADADLPAQTMQ